MYTRGVFLLGITICIWVCAECMQMLDQGRTGAILTLVVCHNNNIHQLIVDAGKTALLVLINVSSPSSLPQAFCSYASPVVLARTGLDLHQLTGLL